MRSISRSSRFVSKPTCYIAIAIASLGLAACGGGGGGGNDSPPPSGPANPPPANTAPTVSAGDDQTLTLPTNSADLSGSASDAENNTLTYEWTASPADGVTFDSASAAATRVTFTSAGTYTLTLTANDGTTTGSDTVQVIVNDVGAPANTAPTVDAGADQTIQLPTNSVSLQATATDTENDTLTYQWAASPPDGVAFADAAAAATSVTFTTAGAYTLTLTVSDGTNSVSDTVAVTVNAEGTPEIAWPGADAEDDPNHGWVAVAPADVGMDSARLQEAQTYALTGGGAGMVVRYGKLVHQWSDATSNPAQVIDIDQKMDVKSTTKSMGGIALGIALDQGLITLGDLAKTHLPTLGNPPANDPAALDAITIQQLATHTAGFDKGGDAPPITYGPPGTQWFYSDGGLNWLADVLTTKFNADLQDLLTERVWTPLEITGDDLTWRAGTLDANQLEFRDLASGMSANVNAMARIGLLFLRKGMWKDQRILSETFVATASTPRPETAAAAVVDPTGFPSANLDYGLLWWTNATGRLPDVPRDAYWAWGLGDSLIVVIPSLDLVIARVGSHADGTGPHWRYVGEPGNSRAAWNGDYSVLSPFLTPIVQSVAPAQ